MLRIGGIAIHAFPLLMLAGFIAARIGFLRRIERIPLTRLQAAHAELIVVASMLWCAHFVDAIYEPWILERTGWAFWNPMDGMSSFGGLLGFCLGYAIFCRVHRLDPGCAVRMLDQCVRVGPMGLCLTRLGCAAVHDHPGLPSNSWLAVRFPDGGRWDLGLLEAVYWALMTALMWRLERRSWRSGTLPAVFFFSYAIFRFLLDYLRPDRTFLAGVSVDHWAAMATAAAGAAMALHARRSRPAASIPSLEVTHAI